MNICIYSDNGSSIIPDRNIISDIILFRNDNFNHVYEKWVTSGKVKLTWRCGSLEIELGDLDEYKKEDQTNLHFGLAISKLNKDLLKTEKDLIISNVDFISKYLIEGEAS